MKHVLLICCLTGIMCASTAYPFFDLLRSEDEHLQIAISSENGSEALRATENISDQMKLALVLVQAKEEAARTEASIRIEDPEAWLYVAKHSPNVDTRRNAVRHVTDQMELAKIVLNDEKCRDAAFRDITDPDACAHILKHISFRFGTSDIYGILPKAMDKVTDQAVIADIAQNAESCSVREMATGKVEDPRVLANIAKTDDYDIVRLRAVSKLEAHQDVLAKLIGELQHMETRIRAVEVLTDQSSLKQLATDDPFPIIRQLALAKIDDAETIKSIAFNESTTSVRARAIEKIGVQEQASLEQLALFEQNADARYSVVKKVEDQATLVRVATEDPDLRIRNCAIFKLTAESCQPFVAECLNRSNQKKESGEAFVFEGYYIGMPLFDFIVISRAHHQINFGIKDFQNKNYFSDYMIYHEVPEDFRTKDGIITKMTFSPRLRYKITELDDDNFCYAFLRKYGIKGSPTWNYDDGWRVWKSIRYGVSILFNEDTGVVKLFPYQ